MGVISNGTTLLDAGAIDSGIAQGAMTLISTTTVSNAATLSITSGINSTYKTYVFKLINVHAANDALAGFTFQVSTNGGTGYGIEITSSYFRATHDEDGSGGALAYQGSQDLAEGTGFQNITAGDGNDNDQSSSGTLTLYNPADTTFVKHFMAFTNSYHAGDKTRNVFTAGYINSTSAVNAIQFKFSAGNIDTGTVKMYGIS